MCRQKPVSGECNGNRLLWRGLMEIFVLFSYIFWLTVFFYPFIFYLGLEKMTNKTPKQQIKREGRHDPWTHNQEERNRSIQEGTHTWNRYGRSSRGSPWCQTRKASVHIHGCSSGFWNLYGSISAVIFTYFVFISHPVVFLLQYRAVAFQAGFPKFWNACTLKRLPGCGCKCSTLLKALPDAHREGQSWPHAISFRRNYALLFNYWWDALAFTCPQFCA